jgi:hypothetical protein
MKRIAIACVLMATSLAGCGPMLMPMTVQLDPQEQQRVDRMWDNMLTPPDRLDRELLLDVMMTNHLFQLGVDRLHLTAEKRFHGGLAVMEIDCDRAGPPEMDHFAITVVDRGGRMLRHEYYTRPEVEARFGALMEMMVSRPGDEAQQEHPRRRELELRWQKIAAATQPSPT